jgi:diacylglycerol kinase family enzyme
MLRQVADLLGGRHVENATVPYFKAKSVEVHSDPRVPVQIDGELFGATPCRFAIVPKSLTIMVPPA